MTDSNEVKPAEAPVILGFFHPGSPGDVTKPAGAPIPYCCGRNYPKNADWERHLIEIHEAKPAEAPAQPEKCPNCSHPAHVGVCPMPCLCGIRREPFFGDETAQPDLSELDLDHDGPDDVEEDSAAQPITAEEAGTQCCEYASRAYSGEAIYDASFAAIIQRATDSALTEAMRQNAELTAMFAKDSQEAEAEIKRLREQLAERQAR